MQRQTSIEKVKEKKSLFANWDMKKKWATELYIHCCNMREMGQCGSDWGFGNRKLRREAERGKCPVCNEENKLHIRLKCAEK